MDILREARLQAHHHGPLDTLVLAAGFPSGPLLPIVLRAPHPRAWRRDRPLVASPRMPVPPGLVQALGIRRRRDVVQAWSTALGGLVRGFPSALPRTQGQPIVAHPGRRCHALACHGYGWCARRLSQRSCPQTVMPGVAFPPVGLGAPPSPVRCAAQTPPGPSRVASLGARCPLPRLLPGGRGVPIGRLAWSKPPGHARACGHPGPQAGRYARRQVVLPRARVTPLKTCPALRPRWWPVHAPLSPTGWVPSGACPPSACASMPRRLSC
jgi:hypothetical protein